MIPKPTPRNCKVFGEDESEPGLELGLGLEKYCSTHRLFSRYLCGHGIGKGKGKVLPILNDQEVKSSSLSLSLEERSTCRESFYLGEDVETYRYRLQPGESVRCHPMREL